LLAGSTTSPRVLDRRAIDLSDPDVPGSSQPYHAVMGAAAKDAASVEARLCKVVREAARKSFGALLADAANAGHHPQAGGLVVGSDIDPARIKNDHIRAHALEGRLFRNALADALTSHDLLCVVLVERDAYTKAAQCLNRQATDLKRAVAELGRSSGGPWRANEKMAALAAWTSLQQPQIG
jgi:hypothetical protein